MPELSTFEAVFCDHTQIASCCEPDCGHYKCPCGLFWDDNDPFFEPYDLNIDPEAEG